MSAISCLRCKEPIDSSNEQCPHCGEKVTTFQRTYAARLLDGKYQILDRLGIGGMGEIFKVRHIHLNELRVVKIMRPNVAADDQGLQRFLQEARTSTMIKHKNLAMLYDFSTLDDGSYYMVWEFIDGTNIQKWINQNGPVPPRLAVEISIQALNGLEHLHSMGLIHRDISPENIMLSQDHHGKLMVKVIDFGIAKSLAEGESGQGLTQTGMFLGKLKYASPEQAGFLKEGEHLDPRSDLYSFGIVMYEMLAGRAPFQATNPHGYILKHVTEKPAPIAQLNPDVKIPAQLENIVMRSLEKGRDQRFATAAEFAGALEAVRNTIPPDQKYGLGERMVTLSGAKTISDLPKYKTGQAATMGSAPTQMTTGAGGTASARTQADQATVIERGAAPPQRPTIGSNEPTIQERLSTHSAPTGVESKWTGEAQPTVLERQIAKKKPNVMMMSGIAAVAVIGIIVAALLLRQPQKKDGGVNPPPPTSGSVVDVGPPGTLLLSASPWGNIEKIINAKSHAEVNLDDEKRSTPTGIELNPGRYLVTVRGPSESKTLDVQIPPGKKVKEKVDFGGLNLDELQKEVTD